MSELAYTRCGAGAPLVLLHGIGGHVPMPDDPDAVVAFIVEASARVPAAR